jgi:hypothetical protein
MQLNPQAAQALLSFGSNLSNAAQTPGMGFGQGVISSVAPAMQVYQAALAKAKEEEFLKEEREARRQGRKREKTLFEQGQADRETQERLVKVKDYMLKRYAQGDDIASAISNAPEEFADIPGVYSVANEAWREYQSAKGEPETLKDFNVPMLTPDGAEVSVPYSRLSEMGDKGYTVRQPDEDEVPSDPRKLSAAQLRFILAAKESGIDPEKPWREWSEREASALIQKMGSQDFWSMFLEGVMGGSTGGMMGGSNGGAMGGSGGGLTPEEEEELRRLEAMAAGAMGQFGIAPVVSGTIER